MPKNIDPNTPPPKIAPPPNEEKPAKKERIPFSLIIKMAIGTVLTKVLRSWGHDIQAQGKKSAEEARKQEIDSEQQKTDRLNKRSKQTKV